MRESLRFGLAVLAAALIADGCASTGSGSKPNAVENPAPAERVQPPATSPESGQADAAASTGAAKQEKQKRPWMVAPLLSSTPCRGDGSAAAAS